MSGRPLRPWTLLIGVGNRDRADDGAGPLVVDAVRASLTTEQPATLVVEGDLSDLAVTWGRADRVVIVDAAITGAPPGAVQRFASVPGAGSSVSSHGISLSDAIELAHLLGRVPEQLSIITIEAESFDHFDAPSPEVLAAVDVVAGELLLEVLPTDAVSR